MLYKFRSKVSFNRLMPVRIYLVHINFLLISNLPQEWKESIIVQIHKKCSTMICNNYIGNSLFHTTFNSLNCTFIKTDSIWKRNYRRISMLV